LRKVERNRDFMNSLRPMSLNSALVCLCGLLAALSAQAQSAQAQNAPAGQQPQQQQPQAPQQQQ
jgi:hypothetical protein